MVISGENSSVCIKIGRKDLPAGGNMRKIILLALAMMLAISTAAAAEVWKDAF